MNAREVLIAAELAWHSFVASDGYMGSAVHDNGEAADRALAALSDAGYTVVRLPERKAEITSDDPKDVWRHNVVVGWNECLDKIERLSMES